MSDKQKIPIQPRNEYVLIRRTIMDKNPAGIVIPEGAFEGFKHKVQAVGPKVTDLGVGDEVLLVGERGQDYLFLPNSKDLIVTKQENVLLVYNHEEGKHGKASG